MIYLTRRAEFSAAHYYHNPQWTPEQNLRVFGKCANLNGHGHNYTLEVTVAGEVDAVTGFVIDLKLLKDILNRKELPDFAIALPTTENIAVAIWQRLATHLHPAKLHRVRLYEQPDLFVDYYGE
jgi:6-pyruvoyltetrahydropterin/6-carboxytetrahydropterin synthase